MRRLLLIFTILCANSMIIKAQSLKVMTYNIRYATVNDGPDQWEKRKAGVIDLIHQEDPVVFGIQEGLHDQVQYMDAHLPDYSYLGVGRDTGKEEGEYCAVFFRKEALKVLESATFWLSETPGKPSLGWDASYKRICTWALFEHIELKRTFYLLNTHFDHMGDKARYNSAVLILEKIRELNTSGHPVILMGDFNLTDDSEAIKMIRSTLADTRMKASVSLGPEATFNGFDLLSKPGERIDYIFISEKEFKVLESGILDKKYKGRYPSDHFPVTAKLSFKQQSFEE